MGHQGHWSARLTLVAKTAETLSSMTSLGITFLSKSVNEQHAWGVLQTLILEDLLHQSDLHTPGIHGRLWTKPAIDTLALLKYDCPADHLSEPVLMCASVSNSHKIRSALQ